MKRALIALATAGVIATTAVIAIATAGPPEIDHANAVFSLKADTTTKQCAGEDAPDQYSTTAGLWRGAETEVTPGATDYTLTGKMRYTASVTVNLTTHRGVMDGIAVLHGQPAAGGPSVKVYAGPLTLVVQQVDLPGGLTYVGRGLLNALTFSKNAAGSVVRDGGRVLANVEVSFPTTGGAPAFGSMVGQFGDDSGLPPEPTVKDYSVVTNGNICA